MIGVGAGFKAEVNLLALMGKRLRIGGSTLRARPLEEKAATARAMEREVLPLFERGALRVPVAESFPLDAVADGLRPLRGRRQAREDRAGRSRGVARVVLAPRDELVGVDLAEHRAAGFEDRLELLRRQRVAADLAAIADLLDRALLEFHALERYSASTRSRNRGNLGASVRRQVRVPVAERAERRPERALGVLLVERVVDVGVRARRSSA